MFSKWWILVHLYVSDFNNVVLRSFEIISSTILAFRTFSTSLQRTAALCRLINCWTLNWRVLYCKHLDLWTLECVHICFRVLGLKLFNDLPPRLLARMDCICFASGGGGDSTVCLHTTVSVEVRGQNYSRNWTQVGRLGDKCSYPLNLSSVQDYRHGLNDH